MAIAIVPILLVLMYLVLLRPQQQRLRSQRQLVASIDVGDEIITAGGIIGRIVALSDERASIEVADGVVIDFLRAAVSRRLDDSRPGPTPTGADAESDDSELSDPGLSGPGADGGEVDAQGDAGDRPDEGPRQAL